MAAAATARGDAWGGAGDADGEAGSGEEGARSMMSREGVGEAAAGSGREIAAPAIYSGHGVCRGGLGEALGRSPLSAHPKEKFGPAGRRAGR